MPFREGEEETLLSTGEVARLFHVTAKTANRWAREGRLPTTRTPGGHYRYRASEIRQILEDHERSPNPVANEKPVVIR